MSFRSSIQVEHRVVALHHWPGATGQRAYLGHPHMHNFRIKAIAHVNHEDREIEFHDLRDALRIQTNNLLMMTAGVHDFGERSCETIARELLESMPELVMVSVSEDGDVTALVERHTDEPQYVKRGDEQAALARFQAVMLEKLLVNSHKGGWAELSPSWLLQRIKGELGELREAVAGGDLNEIVREAADVANFAMFIADNALAQMGDQSDLRPDGLD